MKHPPLHILQDPKPTLRRCTKPYLCSCDGLGHPPMEIHRPGSACSAISYVGPKTMEFLQNPKSGSGGAANEEWLHIGKCPKPKIQTFWILDWEIWPVWMSFFSIDFLTPPTRKETLGGQGITSRVGGLQTPLGF